MSAAQRARRERQAQELLAAYQKIYCDETRETFIRFSKATAKRLIAEGLGAPNPALHLVNGGG